MNKRARDVIDSYIANPNSINLRKSYTIDPINPAECPFLLPPFKNKGGVVKDREQQWYLVTMEALKQAWLTENPAMRGTADKFAMKIHNIRDWVANKLDEDIRIAALTPTEVTDIKLLMEQVHGHSTKTHDGIYARKGAAAAASSASDSDSGSASYHSSSAEDSDSDHGQGRRPRTVARALFTEHSDGTSIGKDGRKHGRKSSAPAPLKASSRKEKRKTNDDEDFGVGIVATPWKTTRPKWFYKPSRDQTPEPEDDITLQELEEYKLMTEVFLRRIDDEIANEKKEWLKTRRSGKKNPDGVKMRGKKHFEYIVSLMETNDL